MTDSDAPDTPWGIPDPSRGVLDPSRVMPGPSRGVPDPSRNPSGTGVVPFPVDPRRQTTFNREELRVLLALYGRMVADGEWRDYAIDFGRDAATFSVFRRASEMPLYRVVKEPALARRQGAYSVVAASGLVMKRGPLLDRVLKVLEKPLRLVNG